ncbi:MAG: type VII toxin-antitoxin system HepT family RNase toxin [Thermoplasmatota archaeon]
MRLNPDSAIIGKIETCKPYYDHLVELRSEAARARADDWRFWDSVERNLQLALECALDVGEMVIAWKRFGLAEENRDVFRILGDRGAIDPALAERLIRAAGLRNVLVHRYGTIDREKVRKAILQDLPDLDAFAKAVARYVAAGDDKGSS